MRHNGRFCQNEHHIEYTITFYPDYQKKIRITGITIENLPIKLPDAKARQFYKNYVILIGNIYYPGYRYENKHFITGTRVYSCNEITKHILTHIISLEDTYEFATTTNHTTKKKTYKPPPNQKKAINKTNSTKDYNKKHNLNKYKKKYKQNNYGHHKIIVISKQKKYNNNYNNNSNNKNQNRQKKQRH